ncbi:MAG: TlyA family RNA methyltransferase [Deferribacterales bacterium]|jgi:23S rRNA (cytidine1920-2'-O)/16S rRNA (cytidine1409-2'-O)-methyltransferase
MAKVRKERIDHLLVERGLAEDTREAAKFLMAGIVVVDDHRVDKAGTMFPETAIVRLKSHHIPYVSRGGLKLEKALHVFHLDFKDKVVIDIGASTGGFSDVSLQNGAGEVFAVDTGKGQLDPKVANDSRVTVLDATNFRTIKFETIGKKADIFVADVSFISLSMIIPSCIQFAREGSECAFLIKPQFEAKPGEVDKGGIVNDRTVHERVIMEIAECGAAHGFYLHGLSASPIKGAKGNVEYLAYFVYNAHEDQAELKDTVRQVVYEEYSYYRQTSR